MLIVAVALHILVGIGLLGMGFKYITATPPLDYHAEILSGSDASAVSEGTKLVLGALYKGMGGAFAAMGVAVILIALTGVRADLFMSKLTLLAMVVVTGWFATTGARAVEMQTSVKTPWRIAAGLSGLGLLAFVLSLL